MKVCAVIPCFNEQKTIGEVVKTAKQHTDGVVVVDNGSTDKTSNRAWEAGAMVVQYGNGDGVGRATDCGIRMALSNYSCDVVVTLDGDGQHDPNELPIVVEPIMKGEADLAIGSRFLGRYEVPVYRKFGINIITWFYNLGRKQRITDGQSCFRAFNKVALDTILPIRETGFSFSVETLIKARAKGLRIVEVPISCIYHEMYKDNSTLNPVRHGFGVLFGAIKWRVRLEIIENIKVFLFSLLVALARPLVGKGLKLRPLRKLYSQATETVMPESVKIVKVNNYVMKLGRGLDGMTGTLVATGSYEPITTRLFQNILREGMNVVDVGAHIGYYTLLSGKLVGDRGKVWAFEPEPVNFRNLQENIRLNGLVNVVAVDKAVTDKSGQVKLFVSRSESGEHSLVDGRSHIKDVIGVGAVTLDDFIGKEKIDLIKTDTEGNEIAVLRGAKNLIKSNRNIKIITEVWSQGIRASGHSIHDLWALLESYEFVSFCVMDDVGGWAFVGSMEETYEKAVERCGNSTMSVNLFCSRNKI